MRSFQPGCKCNALDIAILSGSQAAIQVFSLKEAKSDRQEK